MQLVLLQPLRKFSLQRGTAEHEKGDNVGGKPQNWRSNERAVSKV